MRINKRKIFDYEDQKINNQYYIYELKLNKIKLLILMKLLIDQIKIPKIYLIFLNLTNFLNIYVRVIRLNLPHKMLLSLKKRIKLDKYKLLFGILLLLLFYLINLQLVTLIMVKL